MEERRSYVVEDRLGKLQALRERGIEPFGYSYDVTAHAAAVRAAFERDESAGALADAYGEPAR
jgi:hypothetical protein